MQSIRNYIYTVKSDLYRITGKIELKQFLYNLILGESFKYIFWMRTLKYTKSNNLLKFMFFPLVFFIYRHYMYKFGISISYRTKIGNGFYIGHFGNIIVSKEAVIGNNCNISQGVTIGITNRGTKKGCPIIGDNVYIGPGAKLIGGIKIGNNVAIGANCVVTKDIPDNAVVVGVPGEVISYNGSKGYINRVYEGINIENKM